jgi:hypothetical protein
MRNAHAGFIGQQPRHELLLKVVAWVWVPLPLALKPLLDAAETRLTQTDPFEIAPNYFLHSVLVWSLIVGIAFGFLVARFRGARQALPFRQAQGPESTEGQPTAGRSDA